MSRCKIQKWLCVFMILVFLAGCGGGSDSSNDGSSNDDTLTDGSSSDGTSSDSVAEAEELIGVDGLTEITEEAFFNNQYGEEGVWRYIQELSGLFEITLGDTSYSEMSIELSLVGATAAKTVDGELYYDSCYVDGFQAVETEYDEEDEEEVEETMCDNESFTYFVSSDGLTYYMVTTCESGGTGVFEFVKLSESPEFDMGSSAVDFENYNYTDVSEVSGICGSLSGMEEQGEIVYSEEVSTDIDLKEYEIAVRVPYQDNYLMLYFSFSDEPEAGEYTLVSDIYDAEGLDSAELRIHTASSDFGASLEDVSVFRSESGSLTIDSVSENAAEGTFIAVVEINGTDEEVSGSFSIAIE